MTPRTTAAAVLVGLSACMPAPAYAVGPPPIEHSLLPEAKPAAPPQPTVQREVCTVPGFDPHQLRAPGQLDNFDLPAVWQLTRGQGQRVAVIDTGVSAHRLLPHLVGGGDYVSGGDGTQDCDGHGTVVAGIIAATPEPGVSGVAPEATLIGIRQSSSRFGLRADPTQVGVGDVNTLARAVRTAADLGASVINVSSVACVPTEAALDDRALGAALSYAVDVKDAVVVAAAGNTGGPGGSGQCPAQGAETTWDTATVAVSPAWYDEYVLTVGSVSVDGSPSAFSLPGPWVDVAAPGEGVRSLSPVGDAIVNTLDGPIGGTSYATPVVSGLAALIRSRFPSWTARQVMARIKATAHHPPGGRNPVVGSGVIDALAALGTDAPPSTARPDTAPAPAGPPGSPGVDPRPHDTALRGAAACLAVLLIAGAAGRLRRGRHNIAGD